MSDSLRVQTEILLSQRLQFGANGSPFLADCAILTTLSGHLTGFPKEIRGFFTWPGSIWPSEGPEWDGSGGQSPSHVWQSDRFSQENTQCFHLARVDLASGASEVGRVR